MRIVRIDGDDYLMTVPELLCVKHIWAKDPGLFQNNPNAPLLLVANSPDGSNLIHMRAYDLSGTYAYPVNYSIGSDGMLSYMNGDRNADPAKRWFGFHPELIPLNKCGDFDPVLLPNPDGTIVTGGSYRVNGKHRALPARGQCPHLFDGMTIGDTVGSKKPIEWICWAGRLISRKPFGITTAAIVHTIGYVDGGHDGTLLQRINQQFSPNMF